MARPQTFRTISGFLQTLATIALIVFVLHAARSVIIPIALAVLASFILAPIVAQIERTGLGRTPSSLVTLLLAGLVLAGVGWVISTEVLNLARELPGHEKGIKRKVDDLRNSGGLVSKLTNLVRAVASEDADRDGANPNPDGGPAKADEPTSPAAEGAAQIAAQGKKAAPAPTVVVTSVDDSSRVTQLAERAIAAVEPLAAAFLVLVLTAFMLTGHGDLRDRVLAAVGRGRMLGATRVLSESARKVSRFLLFQLFVNAGFGLILFVGLWVIGVQYALLWGFLSMLLRFIPYVGTWISFLFPFALSVAMSPGWAQPIEVFVFFAVLDTITGNVVEPLLFGHHTGVSPVALIISAAFWTWIWGPVGLVLSTPITVCLAVMGHNIPKLRPLALLLGDGPALPPAVRYYQRLLAKDPAGAEAVAKELIGDAGPTEAYDTAVIPALTLAARDRAADRLTVDEEQSVFESTAAVLDSLATKPADPADGAAPPDKGVVVGVPGHRSVEGLPLRMLADVLAASGVRTELASTHLLPAQVEKMVTDTGATAIVVSVVPPGGLVQAAYLCRRLRKRFPDLRIVLAYWGKPARYDRLFARLRKAGVTALTTSLGQTCGQVRTLMAAGKTGVAAR